MNRRKLNASFVRETEFLRVPQIEIDGFVIERGEVIKIKGEYGSKFSFYSLTTNTKTGAQWVDCFQIASSQLGVFRSFKSDRIKRIPKKGMRAKRANN